MVGRFLDVGIPVDVAVVEVNEDWTDSAGRSPEVDGDTAEVECTKSSSGYVLPVVRGSL